MDRRPSSPASHAKHRLLCELGRGGMGTVYLAVAQGPAGFNKLKVVKQLRPDLADDLQFLHMFLDEARLTARLNHPNIVQTNEVGFDGRDYFIEMEYLEGQPFEAVLRRASKADGVPLPIALSVLAQALCGLHHAHELRDHDGEPLGIVHRDVSPHNVFVTYDGAVKLLDFGIAKAADASSETRTGVVKGKATYMAPEQAARGQVDRRADVFAVGVMLWQILAGRRLYEGLADPEIFLTLRDKEVPPVESVQPAVPAELAAICAKATAKRAEDRYPTAAAFQEALEDYLEAQRAPVGARQITKFMNELFAERRAAVRAEIDAQLREGRGAEGGEATVRVPVLGQSAGYLATTTGETGKGASPPPADERMTGATPSRTNPVAVELTRRETPAARSDASPKGGVADVTGGGTTARARRARRLGVGVLAVAALGLGAWALSKGAWRAPVQGGAPSVSSSSTPPPAEATAQYAAKPEAQAAYEAGIQALHDGQEQAAQRRLREAIAADPTFGAPYLRLVASSEALSEDLSRTMQGALQHRSSLSAHDRVLLDAYRYVVVVPQDLAAAERALADALLAHPADPDFALHLCRVRFLAQRYRESQATCNVALGVDAGLSEARRLVARSALRLEDVNGARAAYASCLAEQPQATTCVQDMQIIEAEEGHCDAATSLARRLIAADPDSLLGRGLLACSVGGAGGASLDAVPPALEAYIRLLPETQRGVWRAYYAVLLDVAAGDFSAARRDAAAFESAASEGDAPRFYMTWLLMNLAGEMRDPKTSTRLARSYLAHRPTSPATMGIDRSMYVVGLQYAQRLVSRDEFVAFRTRWLAEDQQRSGGFYFESSNRWIVAFGVPTSTRDDADEALHALPDYLPLPDARARDGEVNYAIGHVNHLAGRDQDASAALERLRKGCTYVCAPLETQHALIDLAEAAFDGGDTPTGCDRLRELRGRWSRPTGPSWTQDRATALERARCAR